MKRREFLKALGALGVTTLAADLFTGRSFIASAQASPVIADASVTVPAVTPQVINIFLYGGASELAGNLTNISDLNLQSQSKYTELNPNFLNAYDPVNATANELAQGRVGQLTPNAFWAHAGGIIMEDMLLDGDMSVYRTCYRKKNNTRAHRPSIFSTQKGTLDIDSAPGIGSTLAAVMSENRSAYETAFGKSLEDLVMPMVSFEGESTIFAPDPNASSPIPLSLKSVGLSANFDNPYQRTASTDPSPTKETLNALVDSRMKAEPDIADSDLLTPAYGQRYKKVSESFLNHRKLATLVGSFRTILNDPASLPLLPEGDPDGSNPDFSTVLFNAYQQALLGFGRLFEHSTTFPEDPLYVAPAALSPQGAGLDNIWVDITTTVDNVTTTVKESRFLAFDGTTILNPDTDPRINGTPGEANRLVYPANNNFGNLLKAAVTLALHNVDTKFIMVGSPGLGGWDDHNSAMMSYEARMQTLMSAVRAAIKHVKYSFDAPFVAQAPLDGGRGGVSTDNIVFNITTDFGRNANLNNSKGWDHGNNQNFYTFGGRPYVRDTDYTLEDGSFPPLQETPVTTVDKFYLPGNAATLVPAVRVPGALGKIVGTTNIFGTPGQNRWFTKPSHPNDNVIYNQDAPQIPSYEFEPQAVASTIYSWFGVTNPEVLTQNHDDDFASGTIERFASDGNGTLNATESSISTAAGEPAIDESLPSVHVDIRLPVKNIVS
ncbi:MAG: hypothetical protein OEY11_11950 [Gammaproteobacteria bacterium]|nr:hypothetical protein [Gammaproteobacteria bacterium]